MRIVYRRFFRGCLRRVGLYTSDEVGPLIDLHAAVYHFCIQQTKVNFEIIDRRRKAYDSFLQNNE